MSTPFYDLASLVVVPSGYKSGKIYAQKPLTTDGQLTFTRASTATRVNASGLIESVTSGVPRLDYLGSTCPKLLLEPQRTNLASYSEQINNAVWAKTNCTITANAAISPDGTQNADNIVTTAAASDVGRLITAVAADTTTYTQSAFFKWVSGSEEFLFRSALSGGTGVARFLVFNVRTGVAVSSDTTYKIENYGNGWFRVSIQVTNNGTNTFLIYQTYPTNATTATQTVSAWGWQMEVGAYVSSYIKTEAAAVTRVTDAAYKTGISSLIGQTEGTIFFEVDKTTRADNDYRVQISDGTTNNWLFVSVEVGNAIRLYCNVGGVNQFSTYGSVITSGRHKVAMAYKANDFKVYVDGVAWITGTSGSVPACSRFDFGSPAPTSEAYTDSKSAQVLLFKTRLTNAQLAELTTL